MTVSEVDAALAAIDRADFLPADRRSQAGWDEPVRIGRGQTNSQPRTVRDMLVLLDVGPGQTVLDVGAGSGWTTALLGHLVGPSGTVVGLELEPELATWGAQNVAAYEMAWTSLSAADPQTLGAPDQGPFDRILVSAAASSLPRPLVEQLADDGAMVLPIGAEMTRVVRSGPAPGDVQITRTHGTYSFVPLR
jgi:protein-L-isoaspartate(D-aspartate) O-methyltransferase